MAKKPANEKKHSAVDDARPGTCGVIMPISEIDNCPESHWVDVKKILWDAITAAGLTPCLVSDTDDVTIIQRTIVQNIYNNEIVVCDVSAKNPNVMFELGMRLAFDKPTIIVKDYETEYSFDTAPIEHLEYPRTLRHGEIEQFKEKLIGKIKATLAKAAKDNDYSTFLKSFGEFKIATIEQKEVAPTAYILDAITELRYLILSLKKGQLAARQNLVEASIAPSEVRAFIKAEARRWVARRNISLKDEEVLLRVVSEIVSELRQHPAMRSRGVTPLKMRRIIVQALRELAGGRGEG